MSDADACVPTWLWMHDGACRLLRLGPGSAPALPAFHAHQPVAASTHAVNLLPLKGEASGVKLLIIALMSIMAPSCSPLRLAGAMRYLAHLDEIDGWCSPTTALAMMELIWLQEADGVPGGLAEIGVHHGRSFIALAAAARPTDRLFAIDVFERQDLNLDNSGYGNREAFLVNAEKFLPGRRIDIVAEDSAALYDRETEAGLQDLRFFSIDGGHTRSLTLNDLQIADRSLIEAGICVLDDVFHVHWPGVITGLFDYLAQPGRRLEPVAFVPNKLVLCRSACRSRYATWLRGVLGSVLERRDVELGGYPIDVYGELSPAVLHSLGAAKRKEEFKANIAEFEEERRRLVAQVAQTEAQLQALLASRSWRLTAPLRAVLSALRGRD